MFNGEICAWCMLPFVKEWISDTEFIAHEHGYSTVCKVCAMGVRKMDLEDIGLQRTEVNTI